MYRVLYFILLCNQKFQSAVELCAWADNWLQFAGDGDEKALPVALPTSANPGSTRPPRKTSHEAGMVGPRPISLGTYCLFLYIFQNFSLCSFQSNFFLMFA